MAGKKTHFRRWIGTGVSFAMAALALSSANAVPSGGAFSNVIDWPIIGIHTTLLPDGRVLTFGTNVDGQQGGSWVYDIWDPALGDGAASHRLVANTVTNGDIFCSVATILPGTDDVLLVGGDNLVDGYTNNVGNKGVRTLDGVSLAMSALPQQMAFERWYGTTTVLANGDVLVQGGLQPDVDTPEVFNPASGTWRSLTNAASDSVYRSGRAYPRSWVAPNGKVFGMTGGQMYWLTTAGLGTIQSINYLVDHYDYATAVMYAPGKLLVAGGKPNGHAVSLIDINGANPVVTTGQPMQFERKLYANATVLPDGKVLVMGGGDGFEDVTKATLPAEMWDPATGQWTTVDELALPRTYHSSALLLPDGRVLMVGGGAPGPLTNLNGEIFSPAYLAHPRPSIDSVPSHIVTGKAFEMAMNGSAPVGRVTLIRAGSSTHGYDVDQRFMDLAFTQKGRRLSVRAPETLNLAQPGYYLLSVLDTNDVPSISAMVSLS